jgi:2,3-bisphosphoglycerate-independent phosphoglycerate mutase
VDEEPFIGESRIPKKLSKSSYLRFTAEMSAFELTDALIPELEKEVDFVCLNFANGDMVGHTGIMSAAIQACEAVDKCVEK